MAKMQKNVAWRTVKLPQDLDELVRSLSDALNISMSVFVRDALIEHCKACAEFAELQVLADAH
jgi:hypothetical protein